MKLKRNPLQVYSPTQKPRFTAILNNPLLPTPMRQLSFLLLVLSLPCFSLGQQPPKAEGSILESGSFEKFHRTYNPWAGVDGQNFLRTFEAHARVVSSEGESIATALPCTPNAVDLNGDGLLDLVVVDAAGYTWFYQNHGTKTEPKFTSGEIIPIMLSSGVGLGSQCPSLHAVDYENSGKIGLVYGDWLGQIFYAPNMGSKTAPKFFQPPEARNYLVPTAFKNERWANYLFPCVTDWDGDGRKDLIVGEGTYSANSIWLFLNQGNDPAPVFNQKEGKRLCLIRGLGREHLTPVVVDWNGDGRPDILTGDREGNVSVFINQTEPNSKVYRFSEPVAVKFGEQTNISGLSRLTLADINGDGLSDAIVGRPNGRIGIALNKGSRNEPVFEEIKDVTGSNPLAFYAVSPEVYFAPPERSTFHLLKVVSNIATEKDTFEEGFVPPPDSKGTHALKLEFFDTKQKVFPGLIPFADREGSEPGDNRGNTYHVGLVEGFSIVPGKEYTITFWTKGDGNGKASWSVQYAEEVVEGKDKDGKETFGSDDGSVTKEFQPGGTWNQVRGTISISKRPGNKSLAPVGASLHFHLSGRNAVYLDDIVLIEGTGN